MAQPAEVLGASIFVDLYNLCPKDQNPGTAEKFKGLLPAFVREALNK